MAHRFAIFCKSFAEDFGRLVRLLASHELLCPAVPFILSVPRAEMAALRRSVALHGGVEVICDEDYTPDTGGMIGWGRQQICKLSVYRTGLAQAYLSVDSDCYLVRPVDPDDVYDGTLKRVVYSALFTKYTAANVQLLRYLREWSMRPPPPPAGGTLEGFGQRLQEFREWLANSGDTDAIGRSHWINRLFQVPPGTCLQPGQILHTSLLAGMEAFFLEQGWRLVDLIAAIPWEYNWYGSWAAAARWHELAPSLSPLVHFACAADIAHAKAAGVTGAHLAQRFKVVQMAARHFDAVAF